MKVARWMGEYGPKDSKGSRTEQYGVGCGDAKGRIPMSGADEPRTVWGIHGGKTGDADSIFLRKNQVALG